jgi:phosphatidate phosphatase APP1
LSDVAADTLKAGSLEFEAVLPEKDKRLFKGSLIFAAPAGITVISDIDDTIKITQVHDRKATLRSTLLEPFKPVEGMAQLYQTWVASDHPEFYYVSASPWQLYLPLADFVKSNGFPAGVFYLKDFRLKDRSRFSLFESPEKYKPAVIEPLMRKSPERKFVLVGDSGERDPEIYGNLARHFSGQVSHIFIRNVTGEPPQSPRYQHAFHDLPARLWSVFSDPSEIAAIKLVNQ